MTRYVVTIIWPRPCVYTERVELEALDAAGAVRMALRLPRPAGATIAVRPCGYVDYDPPPTVPGGFDETAALGRG